MTAMVWLYKKLHTSRDRDIIDPRGSHEELSRQLNRCAYCTVPLRRIGPVGFPESAIEGTALSVRVCDQCGWWTVERTDGRIYEQGSGAAKWMLARRCAWGCLKPLDLSDLRIPIAELRSYLIAKYGDRYALDPRHFEEIVAGVFVDFGYSVRVTSYSRDNGIDVVAFDGSNDTVVGIQVKRYKGKIEAEQIRSFAGALVLGGMTKGVFVTTSAFTKGAEITASRYTLRGISIELEDANRFYDRLKITARPAYDRADDPSAPFSELLNNGAEFYWMIPSKAWI